MTNPLAQMRRRLLRSLPLALTVLASTSWAQQDAYPTKPITVTVGSGPGSLDLLVRVLTESLSASLGQPVIISNRPGANGAISVEYVKHLPPDGYNIMFNAGSAMAINPLVNKAAKYNAVEDFEAIGQHAQMPMIWVANKDSSFRSLQDVVAYARANPGALSVAYHGYGGGAMIYETLLAKQYGLNFVQVPHQTAALSIQRLMAGDVSVSVETLSTVMPFITSGAVRPLAVVGKTRLKTLPGVPSWTEGIMPSKYGITSWYGFFAPKGTPKPIINKLNAALIKAMNEPKVRAHMESLGGTYQHLSPEEFKEFVRREVAWYADVLPAAGFVPQ